MGKGHLQPSQCVPGACSLLSFSVIPLQGSSQQRKGKSPSPGACGCPSAGDLPQEGLSAVLDGTEPQRAEACCSWPLRAEDSNQLWHWAGRVSSSSQAGQGLENPTVAIQLS